MVKSNASLDKVFFALSNPTRRDIVRRVTLRPLTVNQIAEAYQCSLPAVSKHLKKLEDARLIIRTRQGLGWLIKASPEVMRQARDFFVDYESLWNTRLDALGNALNNIKGDNDE